MIDMRTGCTAIVALLLFPCLAGAQPVHPGKPNAIAFPAQEAKLVRFVMLATDPPGQPCVDELEVFGPDEERNLALADAGAKATASSCIAGYAIHQVEHLNDGAYGNARSWIAAGTGSEWAQIELPEAAEVCKVVFSRDRLGAYRDRVPVSFEVRLSLDGEHWETVKKVTGEVRLVRGPNAIPNPPAPPGIAAKPPEEGQLQYAFLGEEHAWLKTYGRADISPALVPYNGRVKEYPRHVGDDTVPLPPLSSAPELDGCLDDACWREASRGVARVAYPYDFKGGPLIAHTLSAGWRGNALYLALRVDRFLSSHVAVVSSAGLGDCGVVVCTEEGLAFNTYAGGKLDKSTPIEGAFDKTLTRFEMRLPLSRFADCREQGLRVGLGMGGKHTDKLGRPVNFVFSPMAIAQQAVRANGTFHVRLSAAAGERDIAVQGNAPGIQDPLTLAGGESKTIIIPAKQGPIGPEYELRVNEGAAEYVLHLFRYDPVERTLFLMEEMADRLAAKGLDVAAERKELVRLRKRHQRLMALAEPDTRAEREVFLRARQAKRGLFFREPDLAPMAKILFVKRKAFRPSHNYSVLLDAAFRPGGGIYVMEVPLRDGRLEPCDAELTCLFDAGKGIARTPMADFALDKVYFGYRPARDGYFHIMAVDADGGEPRQLTDGPFHDYWPCPLPDGGLAFITTRCKARYLCWRPQAAVMFRMDTNGQNMRPLSFANLTEWAPSVMDDGRIIWTRSEYVDKAADFGHTLWAMRPDGAKPELVFGNDIIQPNGYANGRQVPGTNEFSCTLISHFGDLNGPIALVDIDKGRFNPKAISSLTPEVPWPGAPPLEECFRDALPLARDYFLCSHAPRDRFGIFVIDRFGNRELVHFDPDTSSVCPTIFRARKAPPVLADLGGSEDVDYGEFFVEDVYNGIEHAVERGRVKYLRIVEEVRSELEQLPSGEYRADHEPFMNWYASPVDLVNGPSGWPTYVAKAPHGIVPVEEDGSAHFRAPAGKVLFFQVLDKDLNELQRMRSVVQLQPGEKRSCVGCHEHRQLAPANKRRPMAMALGPRSPQTEAWGGKTFSYAEVVQPALDAKCVKCHDEKHKMGLDFTGTLDEHAIPASYSTLITKGLVNYCDYGWNSGGCEKKEPLTFGTVKSKLWEVLDTGHHDVQLTTGEMRRIKTWIDMNCPLWPDYVDRTTRPGVRGKVIARAE